MLPILPKTKVSGFHPTRKQNEEYCRISHQFRQMSHLCLVNDDRIGVYRCQEKVDEAAKDAAYPIIKVLSCQFFHDGHAAKLYEL